MEIVRDREDSLDRVLSPIIMIGNHMDARHLFKILRMVIHRSVVHELSAYMFEGTSKRT